MSENYSKHYTFIVEDVGMCKTEGKFKSGGIECIEIIVNWTAHEDYHEYFYFIKQPTWVIDPIQPQPNRDKALLIASHLNKDEPPA